MQLHESLAHDASHGDSERLAQRLANEAAHDEPERLTHGLTDNAATDGEPYRVPNLGADQPPLL